MRVNKHPVSVILIHWLTFVFFTIGLFFYFYEKHSKFNQQLFYRLEIVIGLSISILTIVRIISKILTANRRPPSIKYFNSTHKKTIKIIYYLIYLFLLFTPLIGLTTYYQLLSLSNDFIGMQPDRFQLDQTLFVIQFGAILFLLLLIIIHIGFVIHYIVKTKDNILKRMFF